MGKQADVPPDMMYQIPTLPLSCDLETKRILKQLNQANRSLAELKGIAPTIPNEALLIHTLTLQEARTSSEVENIVTTQDDLYQAEHRYHTGELEGMKSAEKEVLRYREAIIYGFQRIRDQGLLTCGILCEIQERIELNQAGFRSTPGTNLKRNDGAVVYTPPQDAEEIRRLMGNLEAYINDDTLSDLDPLIKMAVIHHQFESIHPFYDGNGRTGRILNILYLVKEDRLDLPILYLSRYINHNKVAYYSLLQRIRDTSGSEQAQAWEEWVIFLLKGIDEAAQESIYLVRGIKDLMQKFKERLRPLFEKQYKHELLNNLFFHPYTKIPFLMRDLQISRQTASKYLQMIVETGLLTQLKVGRESYYINTELMALLTSVDQAR